MPDAVTAGTVIGGQIIGGLVTGNAADKAAEGQAAASRAGIAEQQRQFDAMRKLLEPFVQAGTGALGGLQALAGLSGPEAETAALKRIQEGGAFKAMTAQGENAILQNASATGGLRGGNTQAALAQFRPQVLNQLVDQQYGRLAGLTTLGQQSAAGVGSAGMQTGVNVANLLQNAAAARAQGTMANANQLAGVFNLPGQILGMQAGAGGALGMGFKGIF